MKAKIKTLVRIRNKISDEPLPYIYTPTEIESQKLTFKFDQVFGPDTQTTEIFEQQVVGQLTQFKNSYSATIFAYGQSGSGKSFTMVEDNGIVFRSMDYLFANHQPKYKMQCVEIYNESIRDLFDPSLTDLRLLEQRGQTLVENATASDVTQESFQQNFLKCLRNRAVGATNLNLQSSRSHLLLIISFQQTQLIFVDLAGSERLAKTNAQGSMLQQGCSINASLLVLGRVIEALVKNQKAPFRDSKLTRLLMNSLGGSASALLIICVSSSAKNEDESTQSLRFGQRCGMIQNELKRQIEVPKHSSEVLLELQHLQTLLAETQLQNGVQKEEISLLKEENALQKQENENLREINEEIDQKYQRLKVQSQQVIKELLSKAREREEAVMKAAKQLIMNQMGVKDELLSMKEKAKQMCKSGFQFDDTVKLQLEE